MTFVLHTWAKSLHAHLMMATLEMETCVRGFHVYIAIREAAGQDSGPSWFASSFLVAGLKYCSNAMCRWYGSCVLSGGAPTPLAHRCSKFHIKIMGDGDRAYMA